MLPLQGVRAMKIALYVPSWPAVAAPNGIVTYASHLVPALRRLGHEVFVLTPAAGDPRDSHTVDLKRFWPKRGFLDKAASIVGRRTAPTDPVEPAIVGAVRDLVARHRIDVFEIEESFGWSYTLSRLRLVPVVVRLHGPSFLSEAFDRPRNESKIAREGLALRHATYVTACTADVLGAVQRHYGLTLSQSRVVPNPIAAVPEAETWRGEASDANKLLFVGRFDKLKGGDIVLRAFERIATGSARASLTFVGPDRGVESPDLRRSSFRQFVLDNISESARSRIDFRGPMSHAEVMSLRPQHSVTIVASRYESQSYALMEAMSYGCPVVATAAGGTPQILTDRRNGLLVPPDDAPAMAAACQTLLGDRALAAKLGRQAWLDCRDRYDTEKIAKQMVRAYEDAIAAAKVRN